MEAVMASTDITLFVGTRREQLPAPAIARHPIMFTFAMGILDWQLLDIIELVPRKDVGILITSFSYVSDSCAPGQVNLYTESGSS